MKFGVIFPTNEIGTDPFVIRDFAQAAEQLGYSHITIFDHIVGAELHDREPALATPFSHLDPFHEAFVTLGFLAATTSRITLATSVLILPQRQTVLIAKQAAELALLSNDRFRLGVGSGAHYIEFEAMGAGYSERGAVMDEQITLLRRLWSEPVVSFSGKYHRIDRAGLNPLPSRPIPIWMGGFVRAAAKRAVLLGDGFVFGLAGDLDAQLHNVRSLLAEKGRAPETFGLDFAVDYHWGPERWHAFAEAHNEPGERYMTVRTMGPPALSPPGPRLEAPKDHIKAIEHYMNEMQSWTGK